MRTFGSAEMEDAALENVVFVSAVRCGYASTALAPDA